MALYLKSCDKCRGDVEYDERTGVMICLQCGKDRINSKLFDRFAKSQEIFDSERVEPRKRNLYSEVNNDNPKFDN